MQRLRAERLADLKLININSKLDVNSIKTTKNDALPFLTLEQKIRLYLYRLSRSAMTTTGGEKLNLQTEINGLNTKVLEEKITQFVDGQQPERRNILYIGPKDYARLLARQEKELSKRHLEIGNDNTVDTKNIVLANNILKQEEDSLFGNITKDKEQREIEKKLKENFIRPDINVNDIFTSKDLKIIKEIIKADNSTFTLTTREKILIQQQLKTCYREAVAKNNKMSKTAASVDLELSKNGFINMDKINIKILDKDNQYSKDDYDIMVENIKTTVILCNPLKNLPLFKYENWQKMNFIFGSNI